MKYLYSRKESSREVKVEEKMRAIWKTNSKMENVIVTISIITLYVNVLRLSRQKINKDTSEYHMDITDIYRIFHPTAAEYTFFSTATWNIL